MTRISSHEVGGYFLNAIIDSFISLNHLPKNYVLSSRYRQLLDCILERQSECNLQEALDEDSHTYTCHYITIGRNNDAQNE